MREEQGKPAACAVHIITSSHHQSPGRRRAISAPCPTTLGGFVPMQVQLGCFTYVFSEFPFPKALQAIAGAGYHEAYRELAPLAQQAGVTLLLKPHTGSTATSKECLETMEAIAHPAVQICYDAGNVHFYEGLAPEEDVMPILPYVKALCLKDHQGPRANANFPVPGEGAVDHQLLFSRLKEGGFSGPMVLERVDGTLKK